MVPQTLKLLACLLLFSTATLSADPVPTHQVVVDTAGNPTSTFNLGGPHITGAAPGRITLQASSGTTIQPGLIDSTSPHVVNVGTLTAATAISAPTGATPQDGKTLTFRFVQDATGGRVVSWDAAYAFPVASPASSLPTSANSRYEITFGWCAADSKWRARGVAGPY